MTAAGSLTPLPSPSDLAMDLSPLFAAAANEAGGDDNISVVLAHYFTA